MTRQTLASMLLLALLLVQGAAASCGVRCLLPAGAQPMDAVSCHGMVMADQDKMAHIAAPCERHACPVDALDAVLAEDHAVLAPAGISSLLTPVWPDEVRLALPVAERPLERNADAAAPPTAFHPLTDSLRV